MSGLRLMPCVLQYLDAWWNFFTEKGIGRNPANFSFLQKESKLRQFAGSKTSSSRFRMPRFQAMRSTMACPTPTKITRFLALTRNKKLLVTKGKPLLVTRTFPTRSKGAESFEGLKTPLEACPGGRAAGAVTRVPKSSSVR